MQNQLSPSNKLKFTPQLFEFFQAVRLLEYYSQHCHTEQVCGPKYEVVRFCGRASLQFPISAISASYLVENDLLALNKLQVDFLGLYGPTGILPRYYTELIIQRLQVKDTSLRDFLDIFNHRIVSLFYHSWEKYHFYASYERAQRTKTIDKFTNMVMSLIGNGTQHLQQRTVISDETFLYYAGLFTHAPRSANRLKAILSDYFAINVEIEQFHGKWLWLQKHDCTCLTSKGGWVTSYNQLGRTILLGQRVWNVQNYFRIKINELDYQEFKQFLPNKHKLLMLIAMTRRYIEINFNFDIQLILKAAEIPKCSLFGTQALGWDCWLKSKAMQQDAQDTILQTKFLLPLTEKG